MLAKASTVKASAKGIVSVSDNGEEALIEPPVKRPRGRPKKSTIIMIDSSPEPPAKRLRARSRMSVDTETDSLIGSIVATPGPDPTADPPVKRKVGRPRKTPLLSTASPDIEEIPVRLL